MEWNAPNLPSTPVIVGDSQVAQCCDIRQLDPKLQYELRRLDDNITFLPQRRCLHHTWAQTFFSRPELYFQPGTLRELQKVVTLARRCRKRLCVTGYGHSPSTLTCTSSWLINLDNLSRLLEVDVDGKPGLVRFEAGISLHKLNHELALYGYTLPNLGSIDVQSLAGAISTGTHGSSLSHGLLSQSVTSLTIILSNSQLVSCSARKNPDLFRAALCSLGSIGIIVEMTFQTVPDFNISWRQRLTPLSEVLDTWPTTLWTQHEYTRVWWMPYTKRAVIWSAVRTDQEISPPNTTFYGGVLGYYIYHNLLALSNYVPRILPWVEWFVFGMQYGFKPGSFEMSAVQPAREGLLMDCLYSQFVNEWAIPLSKGPEAIERLSAWINHDETGARIPFTSKGLWVHCPIEVRVTDTSINSSTSKLNASGVRPLLDPTAEQSPTLYLNATLYRPYGKDPPCHQRYYQAFEWLMKDLGGRPHWAKNFGYTDRSDLADMYGADMQTFMRIRDDADPDGMFLGEWHLKNLPISPVLVAPTTNTQEHVGASIAKSTTKRGTRKKILVEGEVRRRRMGSGWGDGILWEGARLIEDENDGDDDCDPSDDDLITNYGGLRFSSSAAAAAHRSDLNTEIKSNDSGNTSTSTLEKTSRTSEESFDLMAKGEASVYLAHQ